MEHIYLVGGEEVSKAGYNISAAASEMSRAAGNIDSSLRTHQFALEDFVCRLESILNAFESRCRSIGVESQGVHVTGPGGDGGNSERS